MDVVRHEAVSPKRQAVAFGIVLEQVFVERIVVATPEHLLAAVTPLGNMVRDVVRHDACDSRRAISVGEWMGIVSGKWDLWMLECFLGSAFFVTMLPVDERGITVAAFVGSLAENKKAHVLRFLRGN
jgi:hypothetical protein